MIAIVLLVLIVILIAVGGRDVQPPGLAAQPLQERVLADRRAAQAALRPDPQPGRDREGLPAARARDARGGDRGAQPGGQRRRARRPEPRRPRGDEAARRRRGRAHRRARPLLRAGRGLPRPQGQPDHGRAHGGADLDREPDRVRAPGLQRRGDELQHRARDVPHHDHRQLDGLRAGAAARGRPRRPEEREPVKVSFTS